MRLVPVVCCLLLVFAGCQGAPSDTMTGSPPDSTIEPTTAQPTVTTQTSVPTTTVSEGSREVSVEGGMLPYDPNAVWTRVESMLGVDVGAPLTISVENFTASSIERTRFQRMFGIPTERVRLGGVTPYDASGNEVRLNEAGLDRKHALEGTLAHEYVHVVQMRRGMLQSVAQSFERPLSPDEVSVVNAIQEGSAQYVDARYREQYMTNASEAFDLRYLNSETAAKQFLARYHFGAQYVNATIDSPKNLEWVYENPPRTSEELLHVLEPGSEPPANLSVAVETDRQHETQGRFGELFIRTTFGTAVNESVAARTADGWGNDQRVAIGSGNDTEYAWVLRWDDAANATEFEQGVNAYLDARDGLNASVRVERVAPETTVLFVGSESFVSDATASGTNETVTVSG